MKTVKSTYQYLKEKFWKPDPHICALKFAKKNPRGFTLGELCEKSGINKDQCKKLRTEFIKGGIFSELSEVRDDNWGTEQHVYTLSFNGNSQLLAHKMLSLTDALYILTLILVGGLIVQIWIAKQQTEYAAIQSIPEQINQARAKQNAVEFCKNNPEASESGLFRLDGSGKVATCPEVLELYK